jgi:hypothetical protein
VAEKKAAAICIKSRQTEERTSNFLSTSTLQKNGYLSEVTNKALRDHRDKTKKDWKSVLFGVH